MSDWGQGAKNNDIGWGQGAVNNDISWGASHKVSWAGDTNIVGFAYDSTYQSVLDYATAQGYTLPSDSQKLLQNQLLIDLKTAGVWNKLDTFANFATDGSSNFALIDWKRLTQYTAVNSPTFTTNEGFTGNGTSSYIDTNYTTVKDWINVSKDSVCLFSNNLIDVSPLQNATVGCSNTTYVSFNLKNTNNDFSTRLHSNTIGAVTSSGAIGFGYISRNNFSNYDAYFNGVFKGTLTTNTNSVETNLVLFRQGLTAFYNTKSSFLGYASYLNSTEIFNLNTSLNNYLNSL